MWVGWESWAEELVLRADRDPEMGVFGIGGGGTKQAKEEGSLASISVVLSPAEKLLWDGRKGCTEPQCREDWVFVFRRVF